MSRNGVSIDVPVLHDPQTAALLRDDLDVRLTGILNERDGLGEPGDDRLGVNLRGREGACPKDQSDGDDDEQLTSACAFQTLLR